MNKFLIINPFGIGDVLFTTPVIRAIKDRYPDSFIGYWCNERLGELLKDSPKIDRVFALSRGDIKRICKNSSIKKLTTLFELINEIRREKFDIALDFSLDSRYGLWSKLAGIKKRIGLDYKNRGRFLTDRIKFSGYAGKHVVEHNLDLLNFIDPHRRGHLNVPYSIEVGEESRIKARNILKEHGVAATDLLIGVAPGGGASWGKDAIYKRWAAKKFGQLAEKLKKDLNAKVVLLGSVEEKEIASLPSVARNDDNRVIDLVGKLNLKELAAVISELKLLICNDGGPLHMAVALGVKTVSIFGPVDEKVYGPYPPNDDHVVVKKDLSCRPCYKDFRFTGCSNNKRCLEDITVDEVYKKVNMSLRGVPPLFGGTTKQSTNCL